MYYVAGQRLKHPIETIKNIIEKTVEAAKKAAPTDRIVFGNENFAADWILSRLPEAEIKPVYQFFVEYIIVGSKGFSV